LDIVDDADKMDFFVTVKPLILAANNSGG